MMVNAIENKVGNDRVIIFSSWVDFPDFKSERPLRGIFTVQPIAKRVQVEPLHGAAVFQFKHTVGHILII